MKKIIFIVSLLCLSILFNSCQDSNSKKSNLDATKTKFTNDSELIANVTDSIIIPQVALFTKEVKALNNKIKDYQKSITTTNLNEVKNQWTKVSQQYAAIYAFNIGDIKAQFFRLRLYNWPVNNEALEKTIKEQAITAENFMSFGTSVKAIPGIEYLLFENTSEEVNKKINSDPKRMAYLKLASSTLVKIAVLHEKNWNSYAIFLKNNKGTGLDASLSILYNGLNNVIKYVEETKLGKPAGLLNSKSPNPKILQAYYSGTSLQLIESNIKSVENVVFNNKIISISDKIKSISQNEELTNRLQTQFEAIYKAIDSFNTPLKEAVIKDKQKITNLSEAVKNLSISLSTDTGSLLSLIITGTDGDGD